MISYDETLMMTLKLGRWSEPTDSRREKDQAVLKQRLEQDVIGPEVERITENAKSGLRRLVGREVGYSNSAPRAFTTSS